MRLVNVNTCKLHEFSPGSIPSYAILSHRWTDEELTFKDVRKGRTDARTKGYQKLLGACRAAAQYDLDYIWVDTCCIDKTSSAELSESINSMFAWYRDAHVCIAYLEDVTNGSDFFEAVKASVWFTRSWTLQELIAPKQVQFYDGEWSWIGDKFENHLALHKITAINHRLLDGSRPLSAFSVAERMFWASSREATRTEDVTYSLMGLFDVSMPLLYGEGNKAFRRLQEEILRQTSDTTILCWGLNRSDLVHRLLAESPTDFGDCDKLEPYSRLTTERSEFRITNVGLEIHGSVIRCNMSMRGILLGHKEGVLYAALTRRISPDKDIFFKIRIACLGANGAEIWNADRTWIEPRKFLVQWTMDGSMDPTMDHFGPAEFRDYNIAHGVAIMMENGIKIVPSTVKRDTQPTPRVEPLEITPLDTMRNALKWDFGSAMSRVVASMSCHVASGATFSIDLSFDFDACPCLLIYTRPPSDWRTVWRAHATRPILEPIDSEPVQYSMEHIQEHITGENMWSLRSSLPHHSIYARLPAEITGIAADVWIFLFLIHESRGQHSFSRWAFGVGSAEARAAHVPFWNYYYGEKS